MSVEVLVLRQHLEMIFLFFESVCHHLPFIVSYSALSEVYKNYSKAIL